MNDKIYLDNGYYMEIYSNTDNIKNDTIDILKLKLINVLDKQKILIKIDFKLLYENNYKKVLQKIFRITKIINKTKIGINNDGDILLGYVANYDENNMKQKEFIWAINAILYKTRYERYSYIYDTVCTYLDNNFYAKNLCDFKNDKCMNGMASGTIGCCRHARHKCIGPFSRLVTCEYLNKTNKTCDAKCISCKLFTCNYLERKGIKFKIKDILLLDVFLNPVQKYFIKTMVFTPKEQIINRLMKL